MIKKITFLLSFSIYISFSIFTIGAQNQASSAYTANRRTAVRYLQLAKQYASDKQWKEADSNAKIGLAYDDKIADLWYIRSVSLMYLGEKKSQVIPLVVKALTDSEWVDYNRDGARILYADILCTTRLFTQSLAVLDSDPFIYSADAEYIRAKAYYCMGDKESISKARSRIDSARRVYPSDSRFAEIFYLNEYQIYRKAGQVDREAQVLADAFALSLPMYKDTKEDLEIYAAIFADNKKVGKSESKKVRMLKAFNSKKRSSPLYAIEALKAGLLDEDSALDYFYKFSDKSIELSVLEDFSKLLKSEEAKKEFTEYLNSYNGVLTIDVDGDLQTNMVVNYKRGRPEKIAYDSNQDDENEWTAECDFGVPLRISLSDNALELEYSSWPYVASASYKIDNEHSDLKFTLIAETLSWSPFTVESDTVVKEALSFDFFIPIVKNSEENSISEDELMKAALGYSIPSKEREGAVIQVSLLNGVPQIANYTVGEKIYAMAKFEKGLPVSRKLDVDGDGLFETSEYYGFSSDQNQNYISVNDEMQIMINLFGSPAKGTGFYVKKITVDRTGDTIPDFIEEYIPGNEKETNPGKISSWDTDGDGQWDVQYEKYPSAPGGSLREEARFYKPFTKKMVTITSENGIPVSVLKEKKVLPVTKGKSDTFYWLDEPSTKKDEDIIIKKINQIAEQGVSIMVENTDISSKKRFLAVRIEKMIFAMEVSDEEIPDLVNKAK